VAASLSPLHQVDHGTMAFHCQPSLTTVGSVNVAIVTGHGVYSTLDHDSLPTMGKIN